MLLLRPRGGDSHLRNVHEESNTTWTQLVEGSAYRYAPKMRTHCARNSKRFSHLYVFLQVSSCDQFWRRLCDGYNGYGLFLEKIKMSSGCRNVQNHIRTISPLQKCKCTSPPRLKLPRNEAPGPPSCPGSQCFSQPSMAPWRLPGLTTKAVGAKGCALLLSPRGKLLVELAGAWWREVQYP